MSIDEVKRARRKLEQARQRKAELTGRHKALMDRLMAEHKVGSVGEAEKLLVAKEAERDDLQEKLADRLDEIREIVEEMDQ